MPLLDRMSSRRHQRPGVDLSKLTYRFGVLAYRKEKAKVWKYLKCSKIRNVELDTNGWSPLKLRFEEIIEAEELESNRWSPPNLQMLRLKLHSSTREDRTKLS